ncbi:MAG: ATP-binding protein [Bacteroidales bacterium]
MINRRLNDIITNNLNKAIILLGPRQTGKTTLLTQIAKKSGNYLLLDADDTLVRSKLENANTEEIKQLMGDYRTIFIDEAQRIKNIGLTLKIITDRFPGVQLLVSGSSSLELANSINEPLTGRKWEYMLYPVSWQEWYEHIGYLKSEQQFENRLIYGMYPEVITNQGKEKEILSSITGSYLYKDLLSYQGIRKPDVLEKLLQALALQVGNETSYNEIASLIKIDSKTVVNYIDLLEKAFVIFRLNPLSRNLRNEIATSRKIYFYDNGIRNALISNYNPLNLRNDTGYLWENFLISERIKYTHYNSVFCNRFFWRTRQQQEIDYIEEHSGKLFAFEFKWNETKKTRVSKVFKGAYPESEIQTITRKNYLEFIT